jgi:hypothetical protein
MRKDIFSFLWEARIWEQRERKPGTHKGTSKQNIDKANASFLLVIVSEEVFSSTSQW